MEKEISLSTSAVTKTPSLQPSQGNWLKQLVRDRIVQIGIAAWVLFAAAIPFFTHGIVPFDQPWVATETYRVRVWGEILGPVFSLVLIGVIYALTHHRDIDVGLRAPERTIAMRETVGLLFYGAFVLIAGRLAGRLLGVNSLGLHLSGSMFGLSADVTQTEVFAWSAYNFAFYAVLPYCFFRWRGYSNHALCLRSSDLRHDTLVILSILGIGFAFNLPYGRIWQLTGHQIAVGAALAFVFSLFGTGLPIMIFMCSILIPRYKKLTGSTGATVVLGGFTYASLHLSEYWTRYDTLAHGTLSVIFIVLLFGGPGMVKSYLTQRTGNAWVHLWGFHAIWPHVTDDTPIFVKIFGID
jgi:hypothetical protein